MEKLSLAVIAVAILGWGYLMFFHWSFWRADQRLSEDHERASNWPEVVAIIPARDEANCIAAALRSHSASDYRGRYSILLVDDHSADGTAQLAAAIAANSTRLITIENAPTLEPGWTGKLSALQHGLRVAEAQAPDARYVLFTDADIVHAPNTLTRLVGKAEQDRLALVSLMARLDSRGVWGGLLIPAFVFFFQKLYPFRAVNDHQTSTAAAAGGCVLVERRCLSEAGGLSSIHDRLIDDCALAYRLKTVPAPRRIWLGISCGEVTSLRDNRDLSSICGMVTRTAFSQLEYSWRRLLATVLGMMVLYLAAPLAVIATPIHQAPQLTLLGAVAWLTSAMAYWPTLRLYRKHPIEALALPVSAGLYTRMTVMSALQYRFGRGNVWKGRAYEANTSHF
jgi:hopene-associated glycosyltransferase HpnB